MDYGAIPPEINSGRMYAGLGSSTLVAAAASYQALAVELGISGGSFTAMVDALAGGPWIGPSSAAMLASAMPFVTWMLTTAAQAQETAVAAGAAANAWETARLGVIPPPLIAENRVRLMTLISTNFMGVNSGAIAATEAEYDEFWAQDAASMFSFAAEASAITGSLMPFIPPAATADPAGLAAQAAAVGASAGQSAGQAGASVGQAGGQLAAMPTAMSSVGGVLSAGPQLMGVIPQMMHGLTSPMSSLGGLVSPLSGLMGQMQSLVTPMLGSLGGPLLSGLGSGLGSSLSSLQAVTAGSGGFGGGMPWAAMGQAPNLPGSGGKLSVPQAWVSTTQPETTARVTPLAQASAQAAAEGQTTTPFVPAATGAGAQASSGPTGYPAPTGSLGLREHEGRPRSLPSTRVVPNGGWN